MVRNEEETILVRTDFLDFSANGIDFFVRGIERVFNDPVKTWKNIKVEIYRVTFVKSFWPLPSDQDTSIGKAYILENAEHTNCSAFIGVNGYIKIPISFLRDKKIHKLLLSDVI